MSIELLNIDCMEYMKGCEDNAFDLAIVDPPYGINASRMSLGEGGGVYRQPKTYKRGDWDRSSPTEAYFTRLRQVSKNQIVWGANHFISRLAVDSPCWLVWDKNNGGSDFADCELAWSSFSSPCRKFFYTWSGMLQGVMKNKEIKIHPTQKPVKLYDWLLANYAKPGQRILDTHLGSGSSAIAAHYFGVDFVGCEIDKDYYEAAVNRFNAETAQVDMFNG